ncbi:MULTISPECIES: helix-turn-helix domain-containing protein [unclassified Pandoraea]|uniref:helix-turn-helix domain-containing protein n=1 Tax=unclassified Pandoraea TaxID=2624094 RepID=UPI0020164703|nr:MULTISPECIES: hypothetical protein [unclassified Pandoraea]
MAYSNTPSNPFRWLLTQDTGAPPPTEPTHVNSGLPADLPLNIKELPRTPLPKLEVFPEELLALRKHLGMSRNVFAHYLRTNPRTLENWEQGRARPNAQAVCLIRLVQQNPGLVSALAGL